MFAEALRWVWICFLFGLGFGIAHGIMIWVHGILTRSGQR